MPAKTVSDAFLDTKRIKKIVSLKELTAEVEKREGNLNLSPLQRLTRVFNRNAFVAFAKDKTIGAWRLNKMPIHGNNLMNNTFDARGSVKTLETLGHEESMALETDSFLNGMALSAMLEITNPHTPLAKKSVASQVGGQLLAAFDACKEYNRAEYDITFLSHADAPSQGNKRSMFKRIK